MREFFRRICAVLFMDYEKQARDIRRECREQLVREQALNETVNLYKDEHTQ